MRDMPKADPTTGDLIQPAGLMAFEPISGQYYRVECDVNGRLVVVASAGGNAATIADGSDVAQGAVADAAVSTDAAGTLNAHLRGLVKLAAVPATGGQGSKNVTTAATPLALAASTACRVVVITARTGNTKEIAIGWSNAVRATAGSEIGLTLAPGASIAIAVTDLSLLFIDAQVSGEGCSFTYSV